MSQSKKQNWRISASLIVVAPCYSKPKTTNKHDYSLLMVKRTDQTAVQENQTVFPGGLLDTDADENVAWLNYFEQFGVPHEALRQLIVLQEPRPKSLAPQGTGCYDRFFKSSLIWAREISLRLNALRECFEEVGILFCRTREQLTNLNASGTYFKEDFERQEWQQRVHKQPNEFLVMCQKLQVVPDLWSLLEWSAWATPPVVPRLYEAVFFVVFVDKQPSVLIEPTEVKEYLWLTPSEYLQIRHTGEVFLLQPQVYELSRFNGVPSYKSLLEFARNRSTLGTTLFMPVLYMCSDTIVGVLPGDDYYLPESDLVTDFIPFDGTAAEFRARAKNVHRSEFDCNLYLNFDSPNGHLRPIHLSVNPHKL